MELAYFEDTDTLYPGFKNVDLTESRLLDVNTVLDMDMEGNVVAITLEHASNRTDTQNFTISGILD